MVTESLPKNVVNLMLIGSYSSILQKLILIIVNESGFTKICLPFAWICDFYSISKDYTKLAFQYQMIPADMRKRF